MSLDDRLQKLAARGYRWYLALKVAKALLAIPLFVSWMLLLSALALVAVCKDVVFDMGAGMAHEAREFWRKHWFSGFSRSYYNGLSRYRPAPTILPREAKP